MKTLFVTDLDGTLLTRYERISDYSCAKLNRLIEEGLIFTVATARSVWSTQSAIQGLNLRTPAVLYNGGLIYNFYNGEIIRVVLFQEDWKRYVYDVLVSFGIMPFVFGAVGREEKFSWISQNETLGMKRYLARRIHDKRMNPVSNDRDILSGSVFYFKCIGPRDQLENAWNILKYDNRFLCIFHQETYQNDFWMEISPREANKASAVSQLKTYLGCEKAVCFGDTSNDSDMFDVCEEKYAVMNADAWLKEKSTAVIGYCEEDGVAKWLMQNAGN